MKKTLLLFLLLLLVPGVTHAKVQSAKVAVEVNGGEWKSLRLKGLPRNATLEVEITVTGNIGVVLATEAEYKNYPKVTHPLFQSTIRDRMSFTVKIPSDGTYFLVLDNSSGTRVVTVDAVIRGASGPDAVLNRGEGQSGKEDISDQTLATFQTGLAKLFIFDPFPIQAKMCGKEGAFSGPDGVLLCLEFVKKVAGTMGSKEKSANVLLFAVSHEIGHILLSQWGYPFYDNEEIADEFATMLIIMLGQKDRLGAMTEFFISNPASNELIAKAFKGDRHPLSIERARNIVRWMKDAGRFKRWQTIFVPHMQTAVLKKIKNTPSLPFDPKVIDRELIMRNRAES